MPKLETVLHRWRTARRITLGAIVVAGTMATATAVSHRVGNYPCHRGQLDQNSYSYSGIGVELVQDGEDFVVARVFPDTPADGKLQPGAILVSVDGEQPTNMQQWTRMIRGESGTEVELEVVYPCSGQDTVVLEREVIELTDENLRQRHHKRRHHHHRRHH